MHGLKVDFPRFTDTNALQWIYQAGQFFEIYQIPKDQKVPLASVYFDPEVLPWYQMTRWNNLGFPWSLFSHALELEFGPSPFDCPRTALFKLIQQGSVHDYHLQFTTLANRRMGMIAEAMRDCFSSGLKSEIRNDVVAL